jgi:omega-hydroxy-beta-dihydromenaquinone-9 sulfotransferase
VRYEDLVTDPVGEMERLYSELGIDSFQAVRPKVEEHVARVSGHQRNRFLLSPIQKERLDEQWGTIIHQKGYCQPGDHIGLEG